MIPLQDLAVAAQNTVSTGDSIVIVMLLVTMIVCVWMVLREK